MDRTSRAEPRARDRDGRRDGVPRVAPVHDGVGARVRDGRPERPSDVVVETPRRAHLPAADPRRSLYLSGRCPGGSAQPGAASRPEPFVRCVDNDEVSFFHSSEKEMRKGRVLLATIAMAAASACGSDSTGPGGGSGAPPVASNQVSIGNDFFNAPNIVVSAGTTVTWTWNSGGTEHNVTFSDAASGDK